MSAEARLGCSPPICPPCNPLQGCHRSAALQRRLTSFYARPLIQAWPFSKLPLPRGDELFAHTKGCSKAEDGEGRAFGIAPCRKRLLQRREAPLPTILKGLRDALRVASGGSALEGDLTLLVVRLPSTLSKRGGR
ncbi:MAG: hypothetical protein VKM17_03030 [Cyanobacteriota bacterium]|nr:hypothetical protein [Cyanobacteriota bacterium]